MGWKMVYNFLGKDEKMEKSLLTFALNINVDRSRTFFRTVYSNKIQTQTTNPEYTKG